MPRFYIDTKNHTHTVTHICLPAADAASKEQILASIRQIMERMRDNASENADGLKF